MTAGILRKNPNIKWTKDRGREPERDKDEYPWFWSGKDFTRRRSRQRCPSDQRPEEGGAGQGGFGVELSEMAR